MQRRDPLLGRERELAELRGHLAAAADGQGGLVLLAGEAGVGKTRLAESAAAEAGVVCLRGAGVERGSAPYAPIAAAFSGYVRGEPDGVSWADPLVAQLGTIVPELGPPPRAPDREALVAAIRGGFAMIAERAPTVVLLDDLQWADAATLELLPSLAEAAEERPLLLLAAYRTDEIPRGHPLRRLRVELRRGRRLVEIKVEPLDPATTRLLAARVIGGEPGPTLAAALFDRTQGVPFFVEELAAAMQEAGRIVPGRRGLELADESEVPLPETLRDALRIRTEGLSADGHRALEAAAVLGARVELGLLGDLRADDGVGELLDGGLLREAEPGSAAFRHDLVREAAYAEIAWPRRRTLHREVARLLEHQGAEPALLAHHWLGAGEPDRARPLLVAAARRSCELHAYRDAAAAGRAALELWPPAEDAMGRLAVLEELGHCAQLCGELADSRTALEEVVGELAVGADPVRLAEARRRLAVVYELQGAWSLAGAVHLDAADGFASAGRHDDAAAELLLASEAVWSDDLAATERLVERALEQARRAGDGELESRCLNSKGLLVARGGRKEEGIELLRSALGLALDGGHVAAAVSSYWALGATANAWGDYGAAEQAFEDALVYCRANGLRDDENLCLGCLIVVLSNSGEWARAEALARELLARPSLHDVNTVHATLALGMIATARGATSRARTLLTRALTTALRIGLEGSAHECTIGLALVDELEGTPSGRWNEIVSGQVAQMTASHARGLRLAATFAARRGDARLVYLCADAAASWAERFASADALAGLAHVLGEVALLEGLAEPATGHFEQALERLGDVESPFERALTQTRAGAALIAAGERELGVERLTSAYRTLRKLGARPFAAQAAADLAAAGERVEARLGRRAARDVEQGGLTRRELEILRLVAVGRTNREIAHHLFLSTRTVDMHVRNLLGKLGCRSRTEATGRARDLGLLEPAASGP